ncbi:hypothetical protein JB92DRAFT_2934434 [Gautieria morchelliformis]|nr:hypothetical protein JB92DRAFT_2934434 [Gautieria morchelliformis]
MLTLDPSSHCDVCCETFSSLPECIDCGHVFCSNCVESICEKTWSPRQAPACPFCREPFTKDSVRKVRVELKTPRSPPKELERDDYENEGSNFPSPSEAKRLEAKVARAAASKCSLEEVFELHKEIQQWLASEVERTSATQHPSLELSALLLRAILLNCAAYSEASKAAKGVEADLRERLETATSNKEQLEGDLARQRAMYSQKVRECQDLRSEVNRLKLTTPVPGNGGVRSLAIPPRNTSSPSPLSRQNTARPVPMPFPRPYFSRPSSTTPTASNRVGGDGALFVGSAPTSNTMQSAMRFNASPLKPRSVSTWSALPSEDKKPPERWFPPSDNESVSSEQRFPLPSADRFSYVNVLG